MGKWRDITIIFINGIVTGFRSWYVTNWLHELYFQVYTAVEGHNCKTMLFKFWQSANQKNGPEECNCSLFSSMQQANFVAVVAL